MAPAVGVDPVERLYLGENHDEAYYVWRDAGVKQKTLVHIDAHHDMWWLKDNDLVTIANFIAPALKEGIVSRVFWVVPDATWESARARRPVAKHLRKILKKYPESSRRARFEDGRMEARVLDKPLTVCPLSRMPALDGDVLLDIDLDYLAIPRVSYGEDDGHGPLPWIWPDEFVRRLAASNLRSSLVTLIYSVEGGYTPLRWKYLGDEIALRLRTPTVGQVPDLPRGARCQACRVGSHADFSKAETTLDRSTPPSSILQGMERIRRAATNEGRSGTYPTEAESALREACDLMPASAAPRFHLAHLLAGSKRTEEARALYRQALGLDPTYRTPYNSPGFELFSQRSFGEAEEAHQRTLALDPEDAYAWYGLGQLAYRRKDWPKAEELLRKSLALNPRLIDAQRDLAALLEKTGRFDEAIGACETALKLGLAGCKPLDGPLLTKTGEQKLFDPYHCELHARLAGLHARKGAVARAIGGYRIAIAGKHDRALVRFQLAGLYWKQHKRACASAEAWQGVKVAPRDLWRLIRRTCRRAWSDHARRLRN
jgi:tetratricopeptide (TPR) repeat protein